MKRNLLIAMLTTALLTGSFAAFATVSAETSTTSSATAQATPPAKPDGTMKPGGGQGEGQGGEKPDGTPPAMPEGSMTPGDRNGNASSSKDFTDIGDYSWAQTQINYLHTNGIVKGTDDTTYSPANSIKRGDFALMLTRMFTLPDTSTADNYSDVSSDSYYASATALLKANGIVDGDTFNGEEAITREDAIDMIYRIAKLLYSDKLSDTTDLSSYSDADSITENEQQAVAELTKLGIIQGSDGQFNPKSSLTRAEIAVVFYNTTDKFQGLKENNSQGGQSGQSGDKPQGTPPADGKGGPGGQGGGDSSESSADLTGAYDTDGKTETKTSATIASTSADENAVLVENSGNLTLSSSTVTKSGDSSDANKSNFTGLNAAVAVTGGSTLNISNTSITSAAEGANAIFSTGDGSKATVSNVNITTTGNSSRGLDATYNGTIVADNVTISTTGEHCAGLATDRGEGTVTVDTAQISTAGDGSPCIYSTGNISLTNGTGIATGSQAAVIEGKNSITLKDSSITGESGDDAVMLYQSTSGDAGEGTAVLSSTDSTIATTVSDAAMFYITNTSAEINLENTTLSFKSGVLLKSSGNDSERNWGTKGVNGGNVTLNTTDQVLDGSITCDNISTVALNFKSGTKFTGSIDSANTGSCTLTLASDAVMSLDADCYLDSFTNADSNNSNITFNGHTIHLANGTSITG